MTDDRICDCCGVDMNEWNRKDIDGVANFWEIAKDVTQVTGPFRQGRYKHSHWECNPCHAALDAWAANGGSKQCHS